MECPRCTAPLHDDSEEPALLECLNCGYTAGVPNGPEPEDPDGYDDPGYDAERLWGPER